MAEGCRRGPSGGEARKGAERRRTALPLGLWVVGTPCPGAAGRGALAPDAPQGLVSPRPRGLASVSSRDPELGSRLGKALQVRPHTLQTPRCLHPQVLRVKRLAPWRWLWLNGECPLEERGCSGPPLIPEARLPPLSLEGPHQGARLCGCQDQRAARARPAPASDSAARLQWTVCAGSVRGALPAADGHPRAGIQGQGPGNTPSSSERLHQAPPSSRGWGPLSSSARVLARRSARGHHCPGAAPTPGPHA